MNSTPAPLAVRRLEHVEGEGHAHLVAVDDVGIDLQRNEAAGVLGRRGRGDRRERQSQPQRSLSPCHRTSPRWGAPPPGASSAGSSWGRAHHTRGTIIVCTRRARWRSRRRRRRRSSGEGGERRKLRSEEVTQRLGAPRRVEPGTRRRRDRAHLRAAQLSRRARVRRLRRRAGGSEEPSSRRRHPLQPGHADGSRRTTPAASPRRTSSWRGWSTSTRRSCR